MYDGWSDSMLITSMKSIRLFRLMRSTGPSRNSTRLSDAERQRSTLSIISDVAARGFVVFEANSTARDRRDAKYTSCSSIMAPSCHFLCQACMQAQQKLQRL